VIIPVSGEDRRFIHTFGANAALCAADLAPALAAAPDVLYLGGGFPEVHAARLAENRWFREALGRRIGVEISVNTSFNVAGPIAQTPRQAIDTLRRSRGLDVVLLVADDGAVTAAWHGATRDSGRFTGWLAQWQQARETAPQ